MSFMETYTVADIDAQALVVRKLKDLVAEHKDLHASSSAHLEEEKYKLMEMLEETGKTSWKVSGVGNFSVSEKVYPKLTKDPREKEEFLNWLSGKGKEMFLTYATVNHQSLGPLVREELDVNPDATIPGVDTTFKKKTLSIRKG